MTITEILEQAKKLTLQERNELLEQLKAMKDTPVETHIPKTGKEIVAMLEAMDAPIELVDSDIEDSVEWVKAQRRKRQEKLKLYWDGQS